MAEAPSTPKKRVTQQEEEEEEEHPKCPGAPKKKAATNNATATKPSGRVLVLEPEGKARWAELELERDDGVWNIKYEGLKELVGGYLESIRGDMFHRGITAKLPFGRHWVVYLNEEGRMLGMPENLISDGDHVGVAVLTIGASRGATIGISDSDAELLPKCLLPLKEKK